jgi:hypothetical protein
LCMVFLLHPEIEIKKKKRRRRRRARDGGK